MILFFFKNNIYEQFCSKRNHISCHGSAHPKRNNDFSPIVPCQLDSHVKIVVYITVRVLCQGFA